MKILSCHVFLGIVCITIPSVISAQQLRTQNFSSVGGDISTGGNQRLASVIGQPIAFNSSAGSETKAGFLQVVREVITDNQAPLITYTTTTQGITQGSPGTFTATITDNIGLSSAKIYYKPITSPASSFQNSAVTAGSNNAFSATPQSTWFDNVGMEYYFTAVDGSGNPARSPASGSYYSYLTIPSTQVPPSVLSGGAQQENYRIIAMPYSADGADAIVNLFGPSSNLDQDNSKKSKWRLATYDASAGTPPFIEYPDKLTTFKRGVGYWFILKDIKAITLGQKTSPSNNRDLLFPLTLKPGWNMVGNPYPVDISWGDVLTFNNNADVGPLQVYTGGWAPGDVLSPFQGGFVKYAGSSDLTISIPFKGQTSLGGRAQQYVGSDIGAEAWRVHLDIFQANTFNKIGGIGMDPQAIEGADHYDSYNPPRFINGPEINFKHPADFQPALDVVTTRPEYTWKFTSKGQEGEFSEVKWNDDLGQNDRELFLLDEENLTLVNMRETDRYGFHQVKEEMQFTLFYGENLRNKIALDKIMTAAPYPNPAANDQNLAINLALPKSQQPYQVEVEAINNNGASVSKKSGTLDSGLQSVIIKKAGEEWAGGMYFYRLRISNGFMNASVNGKLIIR